MNRISKLFTTKTTSTQANKPEGASHATIFSRGKGSGGKLFLSLKNLFSRTEKSQAKTVVAQAVNVPTTDSIKSEVTKLDRPELDLRGRVRQIFRDLPKQGEVTKPSDVTKQSEVTKQSKVTKQSEETVSKFDTALFKLLDGIKLGDGESTETLKELVNIKKYVEQNEKNDSRKSQLLKDLDLFIKLATNDKEKIGTENSPQFRMVQSFKMDFDSKFKSMIEKIPGMNEQGAHEKIIRAAIIRAANTELSLQIIADSNNLKKDALRKEIVATLNSQFNNSISVELLSQITNAVDISFDFAHAEKLRNMKESAA